MLNFPQGGLTENQWRELLGIEYTITMYPAYYNDIEYNSAVSRMQELREMKENFPACQNK